MSQYIVSTQKNKQTKKRSVLLLHFKVKMIPINLFVLGFYGLSRLHVFHSLQAEPNRYGGWACCAILTTPSRKTWFVSHVEVLWSFFAVVITLLYLEWPKLHFSPHNKLETQSKWKAPNCHNWRNEDFKENISWLTNGGNSSGVFMSYINILRNNISQSP